MPILINSLKLVTSILCHKLFLIKKILQSSDFFFFNAFCTFVTSRHIVSIVDLPFLMPDCLFHKIQALQPRTGTDGSFSPITIATYMAKAHIDMHIHIIYIHIDTRRSCLSTPKGQYPIPVTRIILRGFGSGPTA